MHIRRANLADTPELTTLLLAAMADDELVGEHGILTPRADRYPTTHRANFARRTRALFYRGVDVFVMAADGADLNSMGGLPGAGMSRDDAGSTQQLLGYVAISVCPPAKPALQATGPAWYTWLNLRLQAFEDAYRACFSIDQTRRRDPEGRLQGALCAVNGQVETKAGLQPGQPYVLCETLAVHPRFQRQGIGTALLDFVKARATVMVSPAGVGGDGYYTAAEEAPAPAASGLPVLVHASVQGERLYARGGFREVGRFSVPVVLERRDSLGEDPVEQPHCWPLLRWDPPRHEKRST